MYKRTKISTAALLVLGGIATLASAQDTQQLERVSITGSAIKRIDAETAVPVTVVKMEDLKKSGVTSVEQIMSKLTGVQQSINAAQAVGSSSGGGSYADMRALGADKTLVLLNGHRISNNAVSGAAPDLNMIPFAAIERIEVLRDGASSLYGTDAIGGVINFITRRDFQGATLTLGYDSPQHPGGKTESANAGFGFGDLNKDRFNIFGFVSYKKQDSITGMQRDFNKRVLGGLSNSTDPANYTQDFSALYNPAAPTCQGTALIPVTGGTQCRIVTGSFVDFIPSSETSSAMVKGTVRATDSLDISLEAFKAKNAVKTQIAPVPYGGYAMNPTMPNGQRNPYFPTANVNPAFTETDVTGLPYNGASAAFPNPVNVQPGFVYVFWRDFPNGNRAQNNKNDQDRLLLTGEGNALGWDYSVAVAYNRNRVDQFLVGGYADGNMIGEGILQGVLNPFGPQSTAGMALIERAALNGKLQTATGVVRNINARASRELGDWFGAGTPVQLAIGTEARHEKFESKANTEFAELVSASTGVDPNSLDKGSRKVYALFGEIVLPVVKNLDVTASLRYDKYDDFGNSTNPKLSVRYQPSKQLLVRGSISTGFRAPTLYELYGSQAYTNSISTNNPINCPGGNVIPGASAGANCNSQFQVLLGGNPNLQPEKSKSATMGVVFEPTADISLGVDFWAVQLKNVISTIPQETLFANYSQFSQYFHFVQPGNLLSITSNCPGPRCGYVDQNNQNLGGVRTNGLDFSAQQRIRSSAGQFDLSLASTYVNDYKYQDYQNGPWNKNVGVYSGAGPVFRWQHNLGARWSLDAFSAGLNVNYKSGYLDLDGTNKVRPFTTVDLFGSWSPIKPLSLTVGVRNLFDQDSPFTTQDSQFQAGGWDSRYADPTGRTYYARATYTF